MEMPPGPSDEPAALVRRLIVAVELGVPPVDLAPDEGPFASSEVPPELDALERRALV